MRELGRELERLRLSGKQSEAWSLRCLRIRCRPGGWRCRRCLRGIWGPLFTPGMGYLKPPRPPSLPSRCRVVDMEYFKNVMLKLFETGEAGSLLPVVATVLRFSPEELERCRKATAQWGTGHANHTQSASQGGGEQRGVFRVDPARRCAHTIARCVWDFSRNPSWHDSTSIQPHQTSCADGADAPSLLSGLTSWLGSGS